MYRNISRLGFGLALAALALDAGGCEGQRQADVTGRVTYNGSPLDKPGGQIVFVGPQGTQVVASIELDGTYRATNVPTGPNRVAVYYPNPEAQKAKRFPSRPKPGEPPPPPPPPLPPPFLTPYAYASVDTSNLSLELEKETVFNADLTGPNVP